MWVMADSGNDMEFAHEPHTILNAWIFEDGFADGFA